MRQASSSDQIQDYLNFHMYSSTRSKETVTTIEDNKKQRKFKLVNETSQQYQPLILA